MIEHVIPLTICGALFLLFGVMGLVGELWMELGRSQRPSLGIPYVCYSENRWWPSFVAHACLCAIYMALTAGYMMEMVVHWHLWGMRHPAIMFAFAAMHYAFAQKRNQNALT